VHNVFGEEEAREICGMTVCPHNRRDQLVWAEGQNDDFIVRSDYHLAKETGFKEEGRCSNANILKNWWKGVWKIKGASVVKTFIWQACNNILPTKEMLCRRKIVQDPFCPVCVLAIETVDNIL
jgi:hypothetical protein